MPTVTFDIVQTVELLVGVGAVIGVILGFNKSAKERGKRDAQHEEMKEKLMKLQCEVETQEEKQDNFGLMFAKVEAALDFIKEAIVKIEKRNTWMDQQAIEKGKASDK